MRNIFVYMAFILFLASCASGEKEQRLEDFENVEGILYYQKPETGSTVYAIFIPSRNNNAQVDISAMNYFENGIKFSTANSLIKDKLYSAKYQRAILKGGVDREVYLLPKVKLYFHINKPYFSEKDVVEKDLRTDTIVYKNIEILLKYRFSYLDIDSIIVN